MTETRTGQHSYALDGFIEIPPPEAITDDLTNRIEDAWEARENTTSLLVKCLSALMVRYVMDVYPNAKIVILREDTSHLPAHGHVDQILDEEGEDVVQDGHNSEDGHHWPISLDEVAWEMYHVAPHAFIRQADGVKRFSIKIADSALESPPA